MFWKNKADRFIGVKTVKRYRVWCSTRPSTLGYPVGEAPIDFDTHKAALKYARKLKNVYDMEIRIVFFRVPFLREEEI